MRKRMDALFWLVIMTSVTGLCLIALKVGEQQVLKGCQEQGQVEMISGGKIKCEVIK